MKTPKQGIIEEFKSENEFGYQYSRYFSYFEPKEMVELLLDSNFKIDTEESYNWNNTIWYIVIAKK